jgi:hypothetical protein
VAFALPGDFLAMPLADHFSFSADAIGEVSVCRFPREELKRFIQFNPNVMRLLLEFATRELQTAQQQLMLLRHASAEEKVAAFLVSPGPRETLAWPRDTLFVNATTSIHAQRAPLRQLGCATIGLHLSGRNTHTKSPRDGDQGRALTAWVSSRRRAAPHTRS